MLNAIDPALVESAIAARVSLVATAQLADERGRPRCARFDPPTIAWTLGLRHRCGALRSSAMSRNRS